MKTIPNDKEKQTLRENWLELGKQALKTLDGIMHDKNASDLARVKAAEIICLYSDEALKLTEKSNN